MEAHGALAQPAVELVRTLADRIAPRRAGLGGGAVTPTAPTPESTSTGVINRGHHGNRSLAAHKALIKNELKQVLSIAVQRCHALSLEKGANHAAGRLGAEVNARLRGARAGAGAGAGVGVTAEEELSRGDLPQ